jgi:hypothetical protein
MTPLYTSDSLRFFCRKAASFNVLYRNLSDIAHHVPQEDFWIIQVPFLALAEKAFALCQKAVMKQEWERTVLSS